MVDLAHGLVGLVHVSTKGMRIRRGLLSNWAMMAVPKVSA
jgi:hypothetical protein